MIVLIMTAMSTSNAFYRPMPKLLENTLNRILASRLEMRFGRTPFLSYSLKGRLSRLQRPFPRPSWVGDATNPSSVKDQLRALLEARGQKAWINRNENEGWLPCHL